MLYRRRLHDDVFMTWKAFAALALLAGCTTFTAEPVTSSRPLCGDGIVAVRTPADPTLATVLRRFATVARPDLAHYPDLAIVVVRRHPKLDTAGVCHTPSAHRATILLTEDFVRRAWDYGDVERYSAHFVSHEIAHLVLRHKERHVEEVRAEREADTLGAWYFGRAGYSCRWLANEIGVRLVGGQYPDDEHKATARTVCGGLAPSVYLSRPK